MKAHPMQLFHRNQFKQLATAIASLGGLFTACAFTQTTAPTIPPIAELTRIVKDL